jgi:hypothetical protein
MAFEFKFKITRPMEQPRIRNEISGPHGGCYEKQYLLECCHV